MNALRNFKSENLLISICGHLVVVALMVSSFVAIFDTGKKMVAPNRIEIMEIDLNAVRITGDETRLYNTDVPKSKEQVAPPKEDTPAPAPQPELSELKTPSLADSLPEDVQKTEKPVVEEKKVVKKDGNSSTNKTVVRVNRQVMSLDRTLTVSVVDALRVAMTRCWSIDTTRADVSDIRAVAHLTMNRNGMVRDVWFESAARADTDAAFAYVLETIRSAINVCQPFNMLPPGEFSKWEKIQLTFYPTTGKVM